MRLARRAAGRALAAVGLERRRRTGPPRATLAAALEHVRRAGFQPGAVIDVGAAYGDWSRACHQVFPTSMYLLVEPLLEFSPFLERRVEELPHAVYVQAAAARHSGSTLLHVHPDLVGTSTRVEREPGVAGAGREVPTTSVDELVAAHRPPPPYLLKADVQGAELDVLSGAARTLEQTELVVLETLFFDFYEGAPLLPEVVAFMRERGFVVHDVFDLGYRPLDGALSQADVAFVRDGSPVRGERVYARPDQRVEQNEALRSSYERRLRELEAGSGR